MKGSGTSAFTVGAVALLALILPACGGNHDSNAPATSGTASVTTLFSEDFSKAFPGTTWSAPFRSGSGTSIQVDAANGNPEPSLAMTSSGSPAFVGTTTTMSFASRPATFSVQMMANGSGEGSGGIAIVDHTGVSVAAAEWHAATPSALTFRILGTVNPNPVAAPLAGSGFHTFTFSVDATGNATWQVDSTPVMSLGGFPSDMMRLQLYDNITTGSSFATFRFDNISITSP
ncbi:MAG TPA: hypothetical protein VNM14_01700 [Planctomycetota bacterium]|jgi:hypothetical protein|nr:hypothetical protein [Planctomycetota bacterium]